jgi:3-isopropylmalate/(R)-2-methylmalate dehydratase small subunit
MRRFQSVTARAAVLDRPDIDTDQILPKQFLKRIERTGFGEFLFYDWRKDAGFELTRPEYKGAKILLTGPNFGCGSSREHAVWALQDYGFEVVVAPSFGDIFFANATQTGLVPVTLPTEDVKTLMAAARAGSDLTVNLEAQTITKPSGRIVTFTMEPFVRHCLLHGLDPIARTLEHETEIAVFEEQTPSPVRTTT